VTRFWLVRHGPTHAKTMIGWTDLPADLTDHAAVARLAALLPAGARVVSSDLIRAVATADALQQGRARLPHDPRLREIHFGAWEGRTWADVDAEDPTIRAFWERPGEVRAPGGEGWNDMAARVATGLDALAHLGGDIVVVAHFGAILAALQRAREITAAEVFAQKIEPLSLTEIARVPGGWQVGRVNHIA
jgi:alpha-ribazole phosphatase